ncbi:hypothetical protein DYU05_07050 [Mucilaginibacter terrenus]|uniref:Uncharacterized protein n=1 Tax=Mucilaginibacter terrenus TaxID=2482727 RepID=A0A3E2NWG4_9SPHI|nr:hypothetical protein [Mucilaginibacter terrenus]RFZ85348.1 hypothetical protein DYU05_07050 [Mucilaginibacter terrenus]
MKFLASFVLIAWAVTGLYLGIGGLTKLDTDENFKDIQKRKTELELKKFNPPITVKEIPIDNEYDYQIFTLHQGIEEYFTWTVILPRFAALSITAMSFGLLGAVVFLLKSLALNKEDITKIKYLSLPTLGILTGMVVLGLSYILPTIIVEGATEIRPITLMFFCLFCGICSENFYKKIDDLFEKLFKSK